MEQQILEYFLSLKYPISIYPEEEDGYTALIPHLPGCITQGETLEEVDKFSHYRLTAIASCRN
ncbi:type II toxin-antitoxin system HicB family antitoxin [Microcystis sp. LSC13-02]|jgi:hypothetical protein|uniref:type II toxin-antitoxin system HicB family antitoxin n=1 Tax=Microcystis sp. LSC13-02 TaxID=1895004 RepID=UPI00257A1CF3|nr:type II toxin-antitoxin system HicB family antitoxin [Microcystis sp. LSC13-02]